MELSERQTIILKAILTEHIKTAEPVGSHILADKHGLDLSTASIRNEMAGLEDAGYLEKPHTSAGRVPTVKAYRFYIQNLMRDIEAPKHDRETIKKAITTVHSPTERLKAVARAIADLCDNTTIVGFARRDVFYTGLTNLFQQPEFAEHVSILSVSSVVDHLDDVVASIFDDVSDEPQVFLGNDNPFGEETGVLLAKLHPRSSEHLFGILGPVRMPYDHHLALLRYTKELIDA